MQSNPRTSVNVLVKSVKTPVNLLVKLTKLGGAMGGPTPLQEPLPDCIVAPRDQGPWEQGPWRRSMEEAMEDYETHETYETVETRREINGYPFTTFFPDFLGRTRF